MAAVNRVLWWGSCALWIAVAPASGTPVPSNSDLWEGAEIVSVNYGAFPGFDFRDVFGGDYGTNTWNEHPGWAIFENDHPEGTVFTIAWRTAAPVSFNTFAFFTTGDIYTSHGISSDPSRRSISHFVLKAGGETVYDSDVVQPADQWLVVSAALGRSVLAQDFSAEFTQAGREGPRIIELDALSIPEPGTTWLLLGGALVLVGAYDRRRRGRFFGRPR